MATPLSAPRMVAALKAEGVAFIEHRKWRTHNRSHKGPWGPVNGVMIHHTVTRGTDASVRLCYDGHSALPGPLCHAVGAKDGTVYLVGNGRANHAGRGDDDVLRAVIREASLPRANEANTDGNARFYGIELVNMGDGKDPWPEVQVEAAARWAAAICRAHGWNERSVIGHKEWQPGKIDPTFSMVSFRARVRKLLAAGPGKTPSPGKPEEADMPKFLSLAVKDEIRLSPREWTAVPWDTEFADPLTQHAAGAATFATDCQINGVASLRLRGLTPGAEFQARLVVMDDDGDVVQVHPIDERIATAGDTFMAMPFSGTVGAGRAFAVQVAQFGAEPATLHKSYLKAQVWPY